MLGTNGEIQKLPKDQNEASPAGEAGVGLRPLAWLPQTLAAIALRLHSLDANLLYSETGLAERDVLLVSPACNACCHGAASKQYKSDSTPAALHASSLLAW